MAKEGRKYGLFLLVASQRPSELSKTVLSQCSNFVIHRIQNPDDLSQIRQMTPFISEAVLKRLPSLPKQHALVFGTSVSRNHKRRGLRRMDTWYIDVADEQREAELTFLKREIYQRDIDLKPSRITAYERFSERV